MITNEDELAIVYAQLDRAEAALLAIEREVRPLSEDRFQLMAESYHEMIAQLREEIAEYHKVHAAPVANDELVG